MAKRPVYGSEGVDWGGQGVQGGPRGLRGHPGDPMGPKGWFDESFRDS